MESAIRQVLVDNDFVGEWYESPCDIEFREVEAIKPQIEAIVGRELDIDPNVQDATYVTDIGMLDDRYYDRKTGTGAGVFLFAFRFSCFGRMFTAHGTKRRELSKEWNLDRVVSLLKDRDFVYVPEEALQVPYDGPNKWSVGGPKTWWIRFFDYV
jgi:hypothetical protein